jgi:hypothetical protein
MEGEGGRHGQVGQTVLTRDWLREMVEARDSVLDTVSNLDMVIGLL